MTLTNDSGRPRPDRPWPGRPWKVLQTDYVWPSTDPERAVLEAGGAELVTAPTGDEETLIELARDADAIMTLLCPSDGERGAGRPSGALSSAGSESGWTT